MNPIQDTDRVSGRQRDHTATDRSCHHFWAVPRNFAPGDNVTRLFHEGSVTAFSEDVVLEAQQGRSTANPRRTGLASRSIPAPRGKTHDRNASKKQEDVDTSRTSSRTSRQPGPEIAEATNEQIIQRATMIRRRDVLKAHDCHRRNSSIYASGHPIGFGTNPAKIGVIVDVRSWRRQGSLPPRRRSCRAIPEERRRTSHRTSSCRHRIEAGKRTNCASG